MRVLFDFGAGTPPKEATIISSTGTSIQVLTPSVDLGATAQQLTATVKLINEAGTPNEIVVTGPTFTYQLTVLTPKITTVSPASGPIDGGTRVVIYGEGFQAPVQVFFGAAEVQPIQTLFNQITVIAPTARDATADASGTGVGSVSVRVINIHSATQVTLLNAFRYVPKMVITAVGPTEGPASGGTRVRIDGSGFNDPVAVVIGGIAAQPISVNGTEIIAVTGAPVITSCSDIPGAVTVTNVDNGDSANGPNFTFRIPRPVVISATPTLVGQQTTIVVFNGAPGIPRLTINDIPLTITNETTDSSTGLTTFQATVPTTASTLLHTQACPAGGSVPIATPLPVNFTNLTTSCVATLPNGITLTPIPTPAVSLNPAAFTVFTATLPKPSATPPVPGAPSPIQTLNLVNNSPEQLTATSITPTNCGQFNIGGSPIGTVMNSCDVFQVSAQYARSSSPPSTDTCTISITFTDPFSATITKTLVLTGITQ